MLFDFPLNQYLWLGFVRRDARPVIEALETRPDSVPASTANGRRSCATTTSFRSTS